MALDQLDALWDVKKLDFTKKGKAWGQKYSEDQERDEQGRWTDGGGGGFVGPYVSHDGFHTPQGRDYGDDEGYAFHERNADWVAGLSKDEQYAITGYAGFGSGPMNGLMRGEDITRTHGVQAENVERYGRSIEELKQIINDGPVMEEDTVVNRALSLGSRAELEAMVDTGEFVDPAFQSTMIGQEEKAKGYAVIDAGHHWMAEHGILTGYPPDKFPPRESVLAKIVIPAGTHYADVEAVRATDRFMGKDYKGESELLFNPANYLVMGVKFNAGELHDAQLNMTLPYHELHLTYQPLGGS